MGKGRERQKERLWWTERERPGKGRQRETERER